MITLYGIKNCDTVKKSIQWISSRNIPFEFHDYKLKGISEEKLKEWIKEMGWETLINKKGTTWKKLDNSVKEGVMDEKQAIALMKTQTSIIKRPIIEVDGNIKTVGFDEEKFKSVLMTGTH
jgi:arsenate reductase (glutaredoxin)